jgi:hypothetical protein
MGSILRCFCRVCCDASDDDDDDHANNHPEQEEDTNEDSAGSYSSSSADNNSNNNLGHSPFASPSSRGPDSPGSSTDYATAASADSPSRLPLHPLRRDILFLDCCRPHSESAKMPLNSHARGLHEFFRRFSERWRLYDVLERTELRRDNEASHANNLPRDRDNEERSSRHYVYSPLKPASSFDASLGTPTIGLEEVVLPGSELQKEMARKMSLTLEKHDDECVICMEGFTPDNPRIPTLCGCGENKTYFHLPCLYQWIEQSEDCPSCRQKLRWEEL